MARPTKSLPLYTQIIGRITRPIESESGGTVVDFEGSTPKSRNEAIRASRKPYGRVIDLVDASLSHKICTASDLLGGRWELEKAAESGGHVCRFCFQEFANRNMLSLHVTEDHAELAENIQTRSPEELKAEEDLLHDQLRAQRARKKAEAEFRNQTVDPFGGPRNGNRQLSRLNLCTDKQRKYLWALGLKDVDKYIVTKGQASRMIGQFRNGMRSDEVKRMNRLQLK